MQLFADKVRASLFRFPVSHLRLRNKMLLISQSSRGPEKCGRTPIGLRRFGAHAAVVQAVLVLALFGSAIV